MQRVDPQMLFHRVRGTLAASPVPLRVALSAKPSAERRVALDRLARIVAGNVARLLGEETEVEPDATLPLFPEIAAERDPPAPALPPIEASPSFGQWLLDQHTREDAIGALARQARCDPGFPREGDARAVSRRLNELGADGDLHRTLDDAELDWAAF